MISFLSDHATLYFVRCAAGNLESVPYSRWEVAVSTLVGLDLGGFAVASALNGSIAPVGIDPPERYTLNVTELL